MTELQTAFWWEDLDELRLAFDYMAAVKLLKENGIPVEGIAPLGSLQPFYVEGACAVLERYFTIAYEDPAVSEKHGGGEAEDEDLSTEYEEEFICVWLHTGDIDREKLSEMLASTMGESLFDIKFCGPWVKLIFYPGFLPDPTPLQAAAFVVAFKEEWGLCKTA
jgi:hypothetical protein